ncbi:hypothetical protein LSAT2_019630, partial [Lamellibrachia satsuma]
AMTRLLLTIIGCLVSMARINGRAISEVNLALNQPTYASSVWRNQACQTRCDSERAVDGDRTTDVAKCFVTDKRDNPWWAVRLASRESVALVVITDKEDAYHLAGFTIGLTDVAPTDRTPISLENSDYTSCAHFTGVVPPGQTVNTECGTHNAGGRFLFVLRRGTSLYLQMAELEVYAWNGVYFAKLTSTPGIIPTNRKRNITNKSYTGSSNSNIRSTCINSTATANNTRRTYPSRSSVNSGSRTTGRNRNRINLQKQQ